MAKDVCEVTCINEGKVKRVKQQLAEQDPGEAAKFFKVLSDETRLKIIYALLIEDELCVCDVANIVGTTAAAASHHLRFLKNLRIATYRKEGKLVYYSLNDKHVKLLIQLAFDQQKEDEFVE